MVRVPRRHGIAGEEKDADGGRSNFFWQKNVLHEQALECEEVGSKVFFSEVSPHLLLKRASLLLPLTVTFSI